MDRNQLQTNAVKCRTKNFTGDGRLKPPWSLVVLMICFIVGIVLAISK